MSDKPPFFFDQFVPGFDFLKNLAGGAATGGKGAAPGMSAMPGMPGMSNWVAPTLSVDEVDKRIQEMKAVQFWLEQNLHALKATIQALEVQKMTLSTLQGMNLRMEDLAKAFVSGVPAHKHPAHEAPDEPAPASAPKEEGKPAPGIVDPMKLWGALADQFQQIAKTALSDAAHLKMPGMPAAATAAAVPPKKTAARKAPAARKARAPAAGKATRKKTQTRT